MLILDANSKVDVTRRIHVKDRKVTQSNLPSEDFREKKHKYTLQEALNQGRTVFRAIDNETGENVVYKIVDDSFIGVTSESHQARKLVALPENKLARYRDMFMQGNQLIVVLNYEEGQSLDQIEMEEEYSQKRVETIISITRQALRIMAVIRNSNVAHRDIKPENLILNDQNLTFVDPGIMTRIEHYDPTDIIGTPKFMAPEIWTQQGITMTSDTYSLGLTFFSLLGKDIVSTVAPWLWPEVAIADSQIKGMHLTESYLRQPLLTTTLRKKLNEYPKKFQFIMRAIFNFIIGATKHTPQERPIDFKHTLAILEQKI